MHQPQIGDAVFHLAPSVEPLGANQTVAHSSVEECFFHQTGLRVGAVHDREFFGLVAVMGYLSFDLIDHVFRFGAVIIGFIQVDPFTFIAVCLQMS